MEEYLEKNRVYWNALTQVHTESEFYKTEEFIKSINSLPQIDQKLLSGISGKDVLHLQCHFGQDTISMSHMGAKAIGLDLSDEAIQYAKSLNQLIGSQTQFINANVLNSYDSISQSNLDLPIDKKFDYIYTSYGTIGWLPELETWSEQIDLLLRNGGIFIIVEFHPFIFTLNEEFTQFAYSYFNEKAILEESSESYTGDKLNTEYEILTWNHPLSDVIQSLLNRGLRLKNFEEYDFSPYPCFPNMKEIDKGKFKFEHIDINIPIVYSLVFTKP